MIRNFDSNVEASKKLIPSFKGSYCKFRNNCFLVLDIDGF